MYCNCAFGRPLSAAIRHARNPASYPSLRRGRPSTPARPPAGQLPSVNARQSRENGELAPERRQQRAQWKLLRSERRTEMQSLATTDDKSTRRLQTRLYECVCTSRRLVSSIVYRDTLPVLDTASFPSQPLRNVQRIITHPECIKEDMHQSNITY